MKSVIKQNALCSKSASRKFRRAFMRNALDQLKNAFETGLAKHALVHGGDLFMERPEDLWRS